MSKLSREEVETCIQVWSGGGGNTAEHPPTALDFARALLKAWDALGEAQIMCRRLTKEKQEWISFYESAKARAEQAEAKLAEVAEQKDKWYSIAKEVEAKLQQAEKERDDLKLANELRLSAVAMAERNREIDSVDMRRYRRALEEIATTKRGGVDRKRIARKAVEELDMNPLTVAIPNQTGQESDPEGT